MVKIESLNLKIASKNLDELFEKIHKINPGIDLDKILISKEKENKELLEKHLGDYTILYDDGLRLIITIHELFKENHSKTKKGLVFIVLTAKMVNLLIGIRKMSISGLPDCFKNLYRTLLETIDIFYACLINETLRDSYSNTDEMYDNNDFYWRNFSKDKLANECAVLFAKISISESFIEEMKHRRKELKEFLSESIHSSFNSSFTTYLMATIDLDFSDNYFGKITTAYPKLYMSLLHDIYFFNTILFKTMEQNICSAIVDIEIDSNPKYLHYFKKYDIIYTANHEKLFTQSQQHYNFLRDVQNKLKKVDE